MLKRQQKDFTQKETVITFGQFILPIALIITIAMLYFSIKMFFYSPIKGTSIKDSGIAVKEEIETKEKEEAEIKEQDDKKITDIILKKNKKEEAEKKQEKAESTGERVTLPDAHPVEENAVIPQPVQQPAVKAEAPKQEKSQPVKAEQPKTKTAADSGMRRWDIQIGNFDQESKAVELLKKADKDGFNPYYFEYKKDGKSNYRVRIKGSENKSEVQAIADKLAKKGYTAALIGIK